MLPPSNSSAGAPPSAVLADRGPSICCPSILPVGFFLLPVPATATRRQRGKNPPNRRPLRHLLLLLLLLCMKQQGSRKRPRPLLSGCCGQGRPLRPPRRPIRSRAIEQEPLGPHRSAVGPPCTKARMLILGASLVPSATGSSSCCTCSSCGERKNSKSSMSNPTSQPLHLVTTERGQQQLGPQLSLCGKPPEEGLCSWASRRTLRGSGAPACISSSTRDSNTSSAISSRPVPGAPRATSLHRGTTSASGETSPMETAPDVLPLRTPKNGHRLQGLSGGIALQQDTSMRGTPTSSTCRVQR